MDEWSDFLPNQTLRSSLRWLILCEHRYQVEIVRSFCRAESRYRPMTHLKKITIKLNQVSLLTHIPAECHNKIGKYLNSAALIKMLKTIKRPVMPRNIFASELRVRLKPTKLVPNDRLLKGRTLKLFKSQNLSKNV